MEKDFSVIWDLKALRDSRSDLKSREKEMSRPLLDDLSIVKDIYRWAMDVPPGGKRCWRALRQRVFIFVVLFLYSPSTLAGQRMRQGLRGEIAAAMGRTGSLVSHYTRDLPFMFNHYRWFRDEAGAVYSEVVKRLRDTGRVA